MVSRIKTARKWIGMGYWMQKARKSERQGEWWCKRNSRWNPSSPSTRNPSAEFASFISSRFLPDQNGIFFHLHRRLPVKMYRWWNEDDDLPTQASWNLSIPSRSAMTSILEMMIRLGLFPCKWFPDTFMFIFLSGNFHTRFDFFLLLSDGNNFSFSQIFHVGSRTNCW